MRYVSASRTLKYVKSVINKSVFSKIFFFSENLQNSRKILITSEILFVESSGKSCVEVKIHRVMWLMNLYFNNLALYTRVHTLARPKSFYHRETHTSLVVEAAGPLLTYTGPNTF